MELSVGARGDVALAYRRLTRDDLDGAVACIAEAFLHREPLTAHLGVAETEFREFVTALLNHCLPYELSWVAIDQDLGRVVGVRVVADAAEDFHPTASFGPKMATIMAFLDHVAGPLTARPSGAIHSHMVAVADGYQRHGIAKRLLREASICAWQRGYRYSIGEVTNSYNRAMLARIKSFEPLHDVAFATFEYRGAFPFLGITEHDRCTFFQFSLEEFVHGFC